MISAFAWTGVLLGFVSLYLMHAIVRHRFGTRAGWAAAVLALGLTSSGVYIGRFLQWNSWDLLVRPGQRLAEIAPRLGEPAVVGHAAGLMLLLTALLAATYLAFYALVGLTADPGAATDRASAGRLSQVPPVRGHWKLDDPGGPFAGGGRPATGRWTGYAVVPPKTPLEDAGRRSEGATGLGRPWPRHRRSRR